tara:strand:- start:9321 stop:9755 length:435 start_codon:yes stop_codon:yes gene_type:complete
MQKVANMVNFFRVLGAQAALEGYSSHEKTAFLRRMMPKSRGGKALLGLGALGAGIAGMRAAREEPSALENMYEGGKEMLSEMSPEEIMGYVNLARSMGSGDYMAYSPNQGLGDLAYMDPSMDAMGYEAQMSPEEMQQYLSYYGA